MYPSSSRLHPTSPRSSHRLAEFHTELELLPVNEIQSNIYLKHPVSMEQYLMEGSYNKVFLAKGNVPAESYIFFVDILLKTIRSDLQPFSLEGIKMDVWKDPALPAFLQF